jgi:hypothetical protein
MALTHLARAITTDDMWRPGAYHRERGHRPMASFSYARGESSRLSPGRESELKAMETISEGAPGSAGAR